MSMLADTVIGIAFFVLGTWAAVDHGWSDPIVWGLGTMAIWFLFASVVEKIVGGW